MHIIILTGAALIGVPILLHLIMRQEPKKLPFPAFRFLKMKRRINQRKMRLRHLVLLAMRMLLIGLIACALFQPTLLSDRFNIKGERPIACVALIDTSPSMGYVLSADRGALPEGRKRGPALLDEENSEDRARPWTALDEARFRALELLDELPPGSKVAVVDSADRDAYWALSLPDARKKIREMKKTKASSRSVSQTLPLAYFLFAKVDQEAAAGQENMPRLLAVFSDRTSPSWDQAQLPYLLEMKENVPKPDIVSTYIDVGVDKPLNLALTGIEMEKQLVAANEPVEFTVALDATGAAQENNVRVRFDKEAESSALVQAVKVEPGVTKRIHFQRRDLAPGLHQAEISLQTPDALPGDDMRYLTFRVREPRKTLIVADAPPLLGGIGGAAMIAKVDKVVWVWRAALERMGWYACDVATVQAWLEMKPGQIAQYEAIVLAELVQPSADVWEKATAYVKSGGKLIVLPGADELLTDGPDKPPPGYDNNLLPGTFKKWLTTDFVKPGVTWAWDALKPHALLNQIHDWMKDPRYQLPDSPQTWGYWEVEPRDKLSVIVSYADNPDADKRRPAVLEKQVGPRGKVLLFTTQLDGRNIGSFAWNNYNRGNNMWFYFALANHAVRYLTGDTEDLVFNFQSGENVILKWPLDAAARSKFYYLSGPELSNKEAELVRGDGETLVRLGPDRLKSAGNFVVISDPSDKKADLKPWREGFSLNALADESNLERLPIDQIEALFGPNSVVVADKERKIEDILGRKFSAPIDLFPFLMILLLLFLAFENLLSNKFYRQAKPKEGE